MFIEEISIEGYKNFGEETSIKFHKGLNVLVGENGTGKSSIIDAIRLLFAEDEYGRAGIRDTDFHQPFETGSSVADYIQIRSSLADLSEQEKVAFLPWMVNEERARLTLRVENKPITQGKYKRALWGGVSKDSMFEPDLFDTVSCIYLPPLRDAEAKLRSGRNSRLARLIINLNKPSLDEARENNQLHPLEKKVKDFNDRLATDEDDTIVKADKLIQERLTQALGQFFSQDTSIQFSEVNFSRIVEGLRLLFFPVLGGTDNKELYRSLEENSLGYNNVLYLATVLAELTSESIDNEFLKVLLIEEPEAHLHPQLQIRLLRYLEEQAERSNIQIVVTTHSPVLASSASLDAIIHLSKRGSKTAATQIKNCGLLEKSQKFLRRWMDVTKSTLLFARGILFVEGIAEAILIFELAHRVLKAYNQNLGAAEDNKNEKLPEYLADAGISTINMGGIYFKHFLQLFCNVVEGAGAVSIPMKCAGITDNDPLPKESTPTLSSPIPGSNHAIDLVRTVNTSANCRLYVSPLKTFEYDLAMQGENLKVMLPLTNFNPDDDDLRQNIRAFGSDEWPREIIDDENSKANVSYYLLNHIDKGEFSQALADKLIVEPDLVFDIPEYIRQAVLWVVGGIDV